MNPQMDQMFGVWNEAIRHVPPAWLSVEQRLPEVGDEVLITDGVFVFLALLTEDRQWEMSCDAVFKLERFAHWLPLSALPPLPKGESGKWSVPCAKWKN